MSLDFVQEQEPQQMENQITETSMKEYFERIVNHVVGLSEQAKRVDELTQRVNDMSDRISNLEHENYNLKQDLTASINLGNALAQERDVVQLDLMHAKEHAHALTETIISRDSRVTELEGQVTSVKLLASDQETMLNVARNRLADQDALISDLRSQIDSLTNSRDHFVNQAQETERENQRLKTDLDRVRSILNPPRVVEPVSEAQVA